MNNIPPVIQAMEQRLADAKTLQDLDVIYVDWIGYSIVEDDPQATEASVREILDDYISEVNFSVCAALSQEAAS